MTTSVAGSGFLRFTAEFVFASAAARVNSYPGNSVAIRAIR
jgi:hypothetical protein